MVQKVSVQLFDDLNNQVLADETVTFALDGRDYVIDLTAANAARLRDGLQEWISAARPAGKTRRATSESAPRRSDLAEIRTWAVANGHQVSDRGRIAANIVAAYDKRNS